MSDEHTASTIEPDPDEGTTAVLQEIIEAFDCTSGTLHRRDGDELTLVASVDIPEAVRSRIGRIPIGKGMAGLAAERAEPVDVCNLQTDDSGVAEEGARATGMEGSLAAPIFGADDRVEGTIGVAKPERYEFRPDEREQLMAVGRRLLDHDDA
ncbi:GAF domain-containing protein [Halococcus thailandensis]|uniref:GAF sensor protein n=1 Tax=Halococcus thailandensis JCM 13552 TaxID=1227457 RepID=M0N4U7_9EURY|nr:GAF domain-containing protein [Halococcus thailandensis]EMA52906.1 GAF sensor protein [Halococcus thailandensis JCM 13552]